MFANYYRPDRNLHVPVFSISWLGHGIFPVFRFPSSSILVRLASSLPLSGISPSMSVADFSNIADWMVPFFYLDFQFFLIVLAKFSMCSYNDRHNCLLYALLFFFESQTSFKYFPVITISFK